jgi:hypothetical protein
MWSLFTSNHCCTAIPNFPHNGVHLFLCISTGGEVVKIAQLASIAGPQSRIAQPETPVTLQFQGNKFTLSHSQLRQLTAGQPLQLQGKGG